MWWKCIKIFCVCVSLFNCVFYFLSISYEKKKSDKFVIPNLSSFSMSVISLFEELHWISILQKTDMLVDKVCKHNVYIRLMKISLRNQNLKIRLRQQDPQFKYRSGTKSWFRWIFSIWYKKNEIMIETDNFCILRMFVVQHTSNYTCAHVVISFQCNGTCFCSRNGYHVVYCAIACRCSRAYRPSCVLNI